VKDLNKHIIDEIVRLVSYLPESYILPIEKNYVCECIVRGAAERDVDKIIGDFLPRWERLSVT
jgi:hypothetical protein